MDEGLCREIFPPAVSLVKEGKRFFVHAWSDDPRKELRAESMADGLNWVSRVFRAEGDEDGFAETSLRIFSNALYAGLSRHFNHCLIKWEREAATHLRRLNDYRDGKIPPGGEVLESIVWHETGGFSRFGVVAAYAAMPYDDYLLTPYWKCLREIVLERDGRECRTCRATSRLQVHHRTYEHRGCEHEFLDDLLTLCAGCHGRIHDKI